MGTRSKCAGTKPKGKRSASSSCSCKLVCKPHKEKQKCSKPFLAPKGTALNCRPIRSACGKSGRYCGQSERSIQVTDVWKPHMLMDVSRFSVYSYGIVNRGSDPVVVKAQIGPNANDFADDSEGVVKGGETLALVPSRFLRFARIQVRAQAPGTEPVIDVYFQAQTAG
ncbi:DUF6385 domain-containing protein [Paenibacillus koleovorans]|uniref:DUF6385 domain-containing protein n=1 Tax=Paenibacillus koleovorans TaxID=121608 RepID=UPI000FDC9FDA|nr:DUF6385 domain-containing protein [Paenibacillus koleovorans]